MGERIRTWGTGSISQSKRDGRWVARIFDHREGRRRAFFGWSREEAERKLNEFAPDRLDRLAAQAGRERQGETRQPQKIPLTLRFAVMQRDGFRCRLCGRNASDGVKLQLDHRVPVSKGGTDDPKNLWTLCFDCNAGKRTTAL